MRKKTDAIEESFNKLITEDFEIIKNLSEDKRMKATFKLIKNLLKSAIGKPHEYTIEEALFILKEELNIDNNAYDTLKNHLLQFSYFKYSNKGHIMNNEKLDEVEKEILEIIPTIITKKNESEAIKIYKEIKNKPSVEPEDNLTILKLKKHKEDIKLTEQSIVKEIESKLKENEIKQKENYIENEKENQLIFEKEFEFKNSDLDLDLTDIEDEKISKIKEDKVEENKTKAKEIKKPDLDLNLTNNKKQESIQEKPIPDNDFTNFNTIKFSFTKVFETTTGFSIDKLLKLEFNPRERIDKSWDLHIKYFLIKGYSLEQIKEKYKTKISKELLNKIIKNNQNYLENNHFSLRTIQEIIIRYSLAIMSGENLEKETKKLIADDFSRTEINFVLEHILKSF